MTSCPVYEAVLCLESDETLGGGGGLVNQDIKNTFLTHTDGGEAERGRERE